MVPTQEASHATLCLALNTLHPALVLPLQARTPLPLPLLRLWGGLRVGTIEHTAAVEGCCRDTASGTARVAKFNT